MWAHILTADTPNSLRGSISEAIQDYSRAIEINPLELNAYCSRGAAFVQQCEIELAIKDFTVAIRLDPDCAVAYANRGNAHILNGKYGLAIQDRTVAIKLEQSDVVSFYNRGIAQLYLSHFDESMRDLRCARDLGYDIAATFQEEYGTIVDFEQKLNNSVPCDMHKILTL